MKKIWMFLLITSSLFSTLALGSTQSKNIVLLISGSASSSGEMELGKLTKLAHLTGHKYYFNGYRKILKNLGLDSFECLLKKDKDSRTLLERSNECKVNLKKYIKENSLSKKSITIIGHSMGGNIARLVASDVYLASYIKNILTISTPHQGTILADYVVDQYENGNDPQSDFYRLIINTLEFYPEAKPYFYELYSQRSLDPEMYHAQDVEMTPGVNYFSISNYVANPHLSIFNLTWNIVNKLMLEFGQDNTEYGIKNDGVLPVFSMIFGKHLETVKADHAEGLCVGSFYYSHGCRNMKNALIRFFVHELKIANLPQALE